MADEVVAEPARGLAEKIDAVNAMTKRLAEKTSGLPKGGLPAVIRSQNTLEAENARLRERLAQTEDIVLQQRRDHERLESTVDGIIDEAQKLESHNQRLENGLIALTTEVRDLRARVGMLAPPGAAGAATEDETSIAVIDMLERVFKTLPANADKPLQQLAQLERACVALRTHTSTLGAAFGVVPEIGAVGAGVAPADETARGSSAGAAAGAAERADAAADVPPPPPAQPTSADGSAVGEATSLQ